MGPSLLRRRGGSVPASRDRGEFLQQQLLAQRVESKVLPHIDADGANLTETKRDVLATGLFLAPCEPGGFDTADLHAQREAVLHLQLHCNCCSKLSLRLQPSKEMLRFCRFLEKQECLQ